MRRSAMLGLLLTLLSALLVLGAAFVFLFQGRQALEERVTGLENSEQSLSQTVAEAQASLSTRDGSLIALEATRTALSTSLQGNQAQLAELQQQNEGLAADIIERDAVITQLQTQALSGENQPPLVVFFAPEAGQVVRPGQPLSIIVSASDPAGVSMLNVMVDDTTVYTQDVGGRALFTAVTTWTPTITEGVQTISAFATNIAESTSPPTVITVTVADPEVRNSLLRAEVEADITGIRGLPARRPVDVNLISPEEWQERLLAQAAGAPSQADAERQVLALSTFNFFPADYPLYQTNLNLLREEQVGFYDRQRNELVVADGSHILTAPEQWLYARNYVHALQDQYYRLDDLDGLSLDTEARLALQALANGDARLAQFFYRASDYFSEQELIDIAGFVSRPESELLTGAPRILQATRAFIEDAGQQFVQRLHQESGWAAVNNAWTNPPISTEQILHPQQYLNGDLPQAMTLPALADLLGPGWQLLIEEPFGEFYLREYLAQQLTEQQANAAAAGWGGGRYAVYQNGSDLVMVLSLAWDNTADDDEFRDAFTLYANNLAGNSGSGHPNGGRCWETEDVLCLYHANNANFIVRAPTTEMALEIAAAMQAVEADLLFSSFIL